MDDYWLAGVDLAMIVGVIWWVRGWMKDREHEIASLTAHVQALHEIVEDSDEKA